MATILEIPEWTGSPLTIASFLAYATSAASKSAWWATHGGSVSMSSCKQDGNIPIRKIQQSTNI